MISRRTATRIAAAYAEKYRKPTRVFNNTVQRVYSDLLYDFLYENDHPAWLCNLARKLSTPRSLQEFVMRLHTGETQQSATVDWTWEQRRQLGQRVLLDLAEDVLNEWNQETDQAEKRSYADEVQEMFKSIQLDGYECRNGKLLTPESDVLDAGEEQGVLAALHSDLGLKNRQTALHHLKLSEEHYLASRWDDSIANSRKFLESVLQEVAAVHSSRLRAVDLPETTYSRPVNVRDYLEREGLLEGKEKEALAKVYGLLSETGSHPYMARNDQARLLRHLALTFSQFVMLRLRGALSSD
jgi:hypothetical protein